MARRRVLRRSAALKGTGRASTSAVLGQPAHPATAAATGTVQATGTIAAVTPPVVTGAEIGARIQASGRFAIYDVPMPWMQADAVQIDFVVPVVRWTQPGTVQEDAA